MQRRPPAAVKCNCLYSRTLPAIFKIVQALSSFIAFCCLHYITLRGFGGCDVWFQIASTSGILVSTLLLFLYILHLIGRCDNIPWLGIECAMSIVWTIFNLSAVAKMTSVLNSCSWYDNNDPLYM